MGDPAMNLQEHHELCVGAGGRSWVVRGDQVVTLENHENGFKVRHRRWYVRFLDSLPAT